MVSPAGSAGSDPFELAETLRSHAVKRGEQALAQLAEARREQVRGLAPETVHALRVTSKRLRAMGQWLRPFVAVAEADAADLRLRDAARGLALAREEHVLAALSEELEQAAGPETHSVEPVPVGDFGPSPARDIEPAPAPVAEPVFTDRSEPAKETETVSVSDLEAAFRAEVERWRGLPLAVEARDLIQIGLGRTLREALAKEAAARLSRKAKAFHRWRKWVKYLRYQLEVLQPAEGDPLADALESVHRLGSLLGKHHDLVDLKRGDRSGRRSLSAAARLQLQRCRKRQEREILAFESLPPRVADALDLPLDALTPET